MAIIASSQSIRAESEMVPELHPVMPVDLFKAAIKGNRDVLIRRLGLQPEEQIEIQVEASDSSSEEINTESQTVQSKLHSATRFGDTILHLLVTEGHNELALMVFQRDMSLLKARNNMLETPLYCAVKVGNMKLIDNLIQSNRFIVKNALAETNKNGDTAFHVAIIEGPTVMVQRMLEVDPTLACTPFSDGMFPVHAAARMGNLNMVKHFMQIYPDDAELRDPCGGNLFHIAAEENHEDFFSGVFIDDRFREMNTATNYEGNTPFHIAAKKGHKTIMRAIWENCQVAETVQNKLGYTPLELSAKQVPQTNEDIEIYIIDEYLKSEGYKFTHKWFDEIMQPPLKNKWERTQVIGLGSVLITTVTFAVAFTMPGGFNQDNGTPVLGRRYMFRAFIIANAMSFIQGFLSLFTLLYGALIDEFLNAMVFASFAFMFAASSMVVAFGLGMYVTLAPVCYPIAVMLFIITLILGTPIVLVAVSHTSFNLISSLSSALTSERFGCWALAVQAMPFLFIFCLALL